MKYLILSIAVLFSSYCFGQVDSIPEFDFGRVEVRCLVAHSTKDGWFSCDFKGTYYPFHIFDSTISKWFIKMKDGDSLFYYKSFFERVYVWNGRNKKEMYGYEWKTGGGSITLPYEYNGKDTLRIIEQVWEPKKQTDNK